MDKQADDSPSGTANRAPAPSRGGSGRRLSAEQEQELARLYAQTRTPAAELARQFGISQTSLMRIAQRHGATRGRSRRSSEATPTTTTTTTRSRRSSSHGATRQATRRFRVRFTAERVVDADDMRQAVAQAEALGAIEITSITSA
jgi:transposase-like protein